MADVGIGSGINIGSIVSSMVAAERAPKETQLAKLEKKTTTQITAVGAMKSAISDFQTALGSLNKAGLFLARSASSSKSDLVGVTANTTAGAGSYQVEVKTLATNSKVALAAIPSTAEAPVAFASGTLAISLGVPGDPPTKETFSVTVDESNNSLAGVRDAINEAGKEKGVSATIVTDEFGSRLVLTSSKTGAGRDISVAVPDEVAVQTGQTALSSLAFDGTASSTGSGARVLSQAQSAELYIDGLKVVSETNKVDGAIDGVTLDLKAKTAANEPLTVNVSEDKAGVKKQVQSFVDAYNKLIGVINSQTKVTSVGDGKTPVTGALVGDATARTLLGTIRNELVNTQGGGAIRVLADMGITTQKDGTLAIDSAKLDKTLAGNFEQLSGFFTGDTGLAARLDAKLKPYTETGGILEQRNKAMTETITKIDKQKEDLDRRITSLQERLYKQFNAMDTLVGRLSNTSASLLASLENLPWAANNSKK
ncbi:flagellar filament capping protein FliD [Stutzerimonas zhaodongensis]|jgi:flagellar hook-associated protein 2|uniref:flagellar filament capping protein FliD n=1 Tax=Stutzerimonas zhaodongensis TaxID=1176257 RepID=UPI001F4E1ECA|nr:flagellar filament capping protein FliD [Stutzerimonas zhaodongensis]UNG20564.1 flagellar filament capping protein FliD [Stutzerimonas zhaodongensis]